MAKDPAKAAAKWARNLQNAGETIREGVQSVTTNPADAAIAALPAMRAGFNAAAADGGKIQQGLQRTTLPSWQQAMIKKGIPHISDGVAAGTPKQQAALAQIIPAVEAAKAALPARGAKGSAANEQRMVEFRRAMMRFKRA